MKKKPAIKKRSGVVLPIDTYSLMDDTYSLMDDPSAP